METNVSLPWTWYLFHQSAYWYSSDLGLPHTVTKGKS